MAQMASNTIWSDCEVASAKLARALRALSLAALSTSLKFSVLLDLASPSLMSGWNASGMSAEARVRASSLRYQLTACDDAVKSRPAVLRALRFETAAAR